MIWDLWFARTMLAGTRGLPLGISHMLDAAIRDQIINRKSYCINEMRLGSVIGRVTLSVTIPALEGGRWLIVSPFNRDHFQRGAQPPPGMSKEPSIVVYDDLGGGAGQTIGVVEGAEATAPFERATPIDAINAALIDEIFYSPFDK